MEKSIVKRMAMAMAIVGTLIFIWGHSLLNGIDSSSESERVLSFFTDLFGEGGAFMEWLDRYIRKLGHFSEYGLLGMEVTLFFLLSERLRTWMRCLFFALFGVAAASIDECIQIFSEGRVADVWDVCLDLAGYATFSALLLGVMALVLFVRSRKATRRLNV